MNFSIDHRIFNHIARSPSFFSNKGISFMSKECGGFSLGFVIPKSLGSATCRNQFKRRCRAAFQAIDQNNNLPSFGVAVKPKIINVSYYDINKSITLWVRSLCGGLF